MITSAFEGLLVPERHRRKAAREGGFAVPALHERVVESPGPFLATNAKNSFLQPKIGPEKRVRYGFSECLLEDEAILLLEFIRVLWDVSSGAGWSNRCSSLSQAKIRLESFGLEARTLVIPRGMLSRVCGEDLTEDEASKLILAQGYVAEVDGIRVMPASVPEGWMLLATSAPLVGFYTRVDNYLGLLFQDIDRTVIVVREDGLAR